MNREEAIEEAIRVLKRELEPTDGKWYPFEEVKKALDMAIEALTSAEPKIYGNEHNCVLTMFGECSYDRNGCGSCEVVDKIREAINAEPKTGKWVKVIDEETPNVVKWHYECDQCGAGRWENDQRYCHNCGARMNGGEEE